MDTYFHADCLARMTLVMYRRLCGCDHGGDELALVHEGCTQCFGAGPGLRTPTIDIDAIYVGGDQFGGARELEWRVAPKLCDCGRSERGGSEV